MLNKLRISNKNHNFKDYYIEDHGNRVLENLSKINIFIGANNSGKSRFLREIFISFSGTTLGDSVNLDLISKKIIIKENETYVESINKLVNYELLKPDYLVKLLDKFDDFLSIQEIEEIGKKYHKYFLDVAKGLIHENYYEELNKIVTELLHVINSLAKETEFNVQQSTFLPVLRTMKKFMEFENPEKLEGTQLYEKELFHSIWGRGNDKDYSKYKYLESGVLLEKTIQDYFLKDGVTDRFSKKKDVQLIVKRDQIFSGEQMYETILKLRNAPEKTEKVLINFQDFLSVKFFSNKKVVLKAVQIENKKNVCIKIGDEPEFPINMLGDGIQAIIILMFPILINDEKEHYFFIEEPETFLHPGMQRLFIEALALIKNAQFFIATHSNHFLDLAHEFSNEISIYSFEKKEDNQFQIQNVKKPGIGILDLLGVKNSSVFLSNCTIWVEGISDRVYIRKYLKLYFLENPKKKQYFEDLNYSFVEYSGNNITHWSFLEGDEEIPNILASSISNRILLIADKDKGKEDRHNEILKFMGDKFKILPTLEIENMLSPEVLKATLNNYRKDKDQELEIENFSQGDYTMSPIGEFIPTLLDEDRMLRFITIKEGNSTRKIRDKLKFAKFAVKEMTSWSKLSKFEKKLALDVYSFIKESNS